MTGATGKLNRILVGTDGSPQSRAALDWAIGIAGPLQAEVIVVYALPQPSAAEYGYGFNGWLPPELDPKWQAEMRDLFESEWCAALDRSGLRSRKLMEAGRPATVIAAVADRVEADLVVVGRRGRGGVAELLLGSVSQELSHHCSHPVVLISMPKHQDAREGKQLAASAGVG